MTRDRRVTGLLQDRRQWRTAMETFRPVQPIVHLVIVKENCWSIKEEFAWINFQTFLTVAWLSVQRAPPSSKGEYFTITSLGNTELFIPAR